MKREKYRYIYEYTDTFGGEANYTWVKRGSVMAYNMKHAVRLARAELGLQGVRPNRRSDFGNSVHSYFGCTVLFVDC